jgi:hypothetical protein
MIVEVKNDCITEVMRYCRDNGFIKIDETEWKRKIFDSITIKILILDESIVVSALGHYDGKLLRSSDTIKMEVFNNPNMRIGTEITRIATDRLYDLTRSQYVGFVKEGKEAGKL